MLIWMLMIMKHIMDWFRHLPRGTLSGQTGTVPSQPKPRKFRTAWGRKRRRGTGCAWSQLWLQGLKRYVRTYCFLNLCLDTLLKFQMVKQCAHVRTSHADAACRTSAHKKNWFASCIFKSLGHQPLQVHHEFERPDYSLIKVKIVRWKMMRNLKVLRVVTVVINPKL